ncbi:MAG TPA: hypothetical protein VGK49_09995, partial [Ilumatobacteraceae bacterium]
MASDERFDRTKIVPRWEWRAFGASFPVAQEHLASHDPQSIQDSDETYLLSAHGDASVKVRDGLMDVKQLQRVNDDGLELWTPVMKAAFPLSTHDVESVLATLNVAIPLLDHDSYELDEVVSELIASDPDLRSVGVHKRRTRYVVDDCMVELTEIRAEGRTTKTLAIESPDPDLVTRIARRFGHDPQLNVSVARGLKALLGFGAKRYAVIDVGTNSVKFHLGEVRADATTDTVVDRAEVTRLGEGLAESGHLSPTAIERTVDAIAGMVAEARAAGATGIVAVGTAGLRMAPDSAEFLDAVTARCGVTVEIISGDEEGRLAYLAATSTLPAARGPLVVFDSGGGSSQFTFGHGDTVDERFSENVGAVRIAERFGLAGAVERETVDEALSAVAAELSRLAGRTRPDAVLGIGGTATNLAAVKHGLPTYDPDVVHGTVLDLAEIDRQIELYRSRSADER